MTKRRRMTQEEVQIAIEEIEDDEINGIEISDNENSVCSDGEEPIIENLSDIDDEQFYSSSSDGEKNVLHIENETFLGKDGTEWKTTPYSSGRTRAHNIIRGKMHKVMLPIGKYIDSTSDAFSLFLDDTMINIILNNTNLHAIQTHGEKWKVTDAVEIRAFIGLLLNAGINKQGIISYNEFWNPLFGSAIFRACMSRDRFAAILRHIRFDDPSTRSARRARDKFAAIREIWDHMNKNLLKHYIPGENLTIDEQLVPFRGRVSFRQYIPSKPDKYGMKIFWICDSTTSYPLQGIPYIGKEGPRIGKCLGDKIVYELCQPFEGSNRNITFDNFFTSFNLLQNLMSKRLTCTGTLRKNKACIPKQFLPQKNRDAQSSIFGFRKNMTIVSYVPNKNSAVILLSTMHHNNIIDPSNKNKPEIILDYNRTKGGVDTLDQMAHAYTVKRKSKRWPLVQFFNIIDVCGIAAMVVWLNLYPEWNKSKINLRRKLFLKNLVEDLVTPQIERRSKSRLAKTTITTIDWILRNPSKSSQAQDVSETIAKIRRRCHMCPAKISRMSMQCCGECGENICNEHSEQAIVCKKCINK